MRATFKFLGTGSSLGIPIIGCSCAVCSSSLRYNKRLRSSGLLEIGGKKILVDAGPDFRQQALKYGLKKVDGVFITHCHYDHVGGLDELRIFSMRKALPCLLSQATFQCLKKSYAYLFHKGEERLRFNCHIIKKEYGKLNFFDFEVGYVHYFQKQIKVTGFKIGNFAYITDISKYKKDIFDHLQGVKLLVISAIREKATAFHMGLDSVISFSQKIGAEKTYLTHIAHEVDHEKMVKKLPKGFKLAYDGLQLSFDV